MKESLDQYKGPLSVACRVSSLWDGLPGHTSCKTFLGVSPVHPKRRPNLSPVSDVDTDPVVTPKF